MWENCYPVRDGLLDKFSDIFGWCAPGGLRGNLREFAATSISFSTPEIKGNKTITAAKCEMDERKPQTEH
jgi:hypothetical protein